MEVTEIDDKSILENLNLLGHKVRDKVSNFEGIVESVGFDLYGCVRAIVSPAVVRKKDKADELPDGHYFDVKRLVVISKKPVLPQPSFVSGTVAGGINPPIPSSKVKV